MLNWLKSTHISLIILKHEVKAPIMFPFSGYTGLIGDGTPKKVKI